MLMDRVSVRPAGKGKHVIPTLTSVMRIQIHAMTRSKTVSIITGHLYVLVNQDIELMPA